MTRPPACGASAPRRETASRPASWCWRRARCTTRLFPDIPGLERFAGPAVHSARWDHGVDIAGKRLAVIGTGASAIQLVPELAKQAAHLTLFQRTPAWVLPKHDPVAGPIRRAMMRAIPLLRRIERAWV